MDADIKRKWLEALRSDKYTQNTDGYLICEDESGMSYCCLGVLCEVIDPVRSKGSLNKRDVLPDWAVQAAGLYSDDPRLEVGSSDDADISDLNDSCGYGFEKLADLIEAQL